MTDETAWLIEFTASPTPLYFTAEGGGAFDLFGADHMKAVRFARRQDAEKVLRVFYSVRLRDPEGDLIRVMLGGDCYKVTEHVWCSAQETRARCPGDGCPGCTACRAESDVPSENRESAL
jgi:hypothetical protein